MLEYPRQVCYSQNMKTNRSGQVLQKKQAKVLMHILLVFRNYCDPELETLITRYHRTGKYLRVHTRDIKQVLKQQKDRLYSKQPDATSKPSHKRLEVTFNYVRIIRRPSGWFLHTVPDAQQKAVPLLLLKRDTRYGSNHSNFFLITDKKGKSSLQFKQPRCQL